MTFVLQMFKPIFFFIRPTRDRFLRRPARGALRPPVPVTTARAQLRHLRGLLVHGHLVAQQHPVLRSALAPLHAGQAPPEHFVRQTSE